MGNFFPKAQDEVIKCLVLFSHQRYLVYSHRRNRNPKIFTSGAENLYCFFSMKGNKNKLKMIHYILKHLVMNLRVEK